MPGGTNQATAETLKDFGPAPEGIAKRYVAEIDLYEALTKDWCERSKKIVDRYRDERTDLLRNVPRFNLLWSNLQTTLPIYYAKLPKADVQRRFKDQDPIGRVACDVAERALDYSIECDDRFDRAMKQGTEDFGLVGRGIPMWQRYVPHFRSRDKQIRVTRAPQTTEEIAEEGVQVSNEMDDVGEWTDENGNTYADERVEKDDEGAFVAEPVKILDYEETVDDYINWEDFGHNAGARTWDEVYLCWRRVYMTRDELHERFDGIIGKDNVDGIPLDYEPKHLGKYDEKTKELFKKAMVYEMWDKAACKVAWISKSYKEGPLDQVDDPLGLDEFFPVPKPIFATTTNNTLVPLPDYAMYQDQASEIDNITSRMHIIEKAIRVRGLYPGNIDAIRQVLTGADDNDMIALDQAATQTILGQCGGDFSKLVYFWPVNILVECLEVLIKLRDQLIKDIYQITGFGDIMRGITEPRETATTSQLKSSWGSLRVKDRQKEIQRFARDALRIKFQVIFNHYEDETIWLISSAMNIPDIAHDPTRGSVNEFGQVNKYGDVFTQALGLLRNQALRHFRVDVETDSTIAPDDDREKQRYAELLGVIGPFFQQVGPVVEQAPEFAPFVGELLMKGVRLHSTGSTLETTLETAISAFIQKAQSGQMGQGQNAEAAAKVETEKTKRLAIQQKAQQTQADLAIAGGQQNIDRGKLALDGIVAERDNDPQVTVGNA